MWCLRKTFAPWCPTIKASAYEPIANNITHFSTVEARTTPTREILDGLKSVKNIRDLSEACGGIRPGVIFRSSCPVAAVPEDVQVFKEKLHIQSMIDLRSDYERQHDVPLRNGLLTQSILVKGTRSRSDIKMQVDELSKSRASSEAEGEPCRINLLSFLERDRYYRSMLTRLPYQTSANILFWGLFNQSHAKTLAIREINRAGLPGLYETILDTAGPEIKKALEVVIEAGEEDRPVLFFCKVGKDRTGILASLILICCNATEEEIVSDYARSDGVDQIALGDMEKDKELSELDTAMFSRAPAEAMGQTLRYFQTRYGGMRNYLLSIGVTQEMQDRLARSLAKPAS